MTPREIFKMGSFGGTYWRPIYSHVSRKSYKNPRKEFPASWWSGIPVSHLDSDFEDYDVSVNKYGVRVGTTLAFWESKNWIREQDPYGWVQWYCRFYRGRRSPDDARQISRWLKTAGPNSRFRLALANRCVRAMKSQKISAASAASDFEISPRVRQTLQHWAVKLRASDVSHAASKK